MIEKEGIISELWARCYSVTGTKLVALNPGVPIESEDCPAVVIQEGPDRIKQHGKRGGKPIHNRDAELTLIFYYVGTSPQAASRELRSYIGNVKNAIYTDGDSLGGRCELKEGDMTEIVAASGEDLMRAAAIIFNAHYVEMVGRTS